MNSLTTLHAALEGHPQAFPFQLPISDTHQLDLKGIQGCHGTAVPPFRPPWYSDGGEPIARGWEK